MSAEVELNCTKLTSVVLRSDIVSQIVVQNEAEETIQQRQIDLLVHFGKHCFHQNIALSFTRLPYISQVVYPLAPLRYPISILAARKAVKPNLVNKERWRLRIL